MALDWLPKEGGTRDHNLWGMEHFGTEPPCIIYEEKPIIDPEGKPVKGLHSAWITLNNPDQFNAYTTDMEKGVIAAFNRASTSRSVVAAVFTGAGTRAFCSGGSTQDIAEHYSTRPNEYYQSADLLCGMVDAILSCRKPTICRVNGLRVAGGQAIGLPCDLSVASDLAVFGQREQRHGSAPLAGPSDFLPWYLSIEDAMWLCTSGELWSAYKMLRKSYLTKVVPVLKDGPKLIRNPQVITDSWLQDGEIVYGEFLTGEAAKKARTRARELPVDLSQLDEAVNDILWSLVNTVPGGLQKSVDSIRMKKRFFWDLAKNDERAYLSLNMQGDAFMGMNAFSTKNITGQDTIDFIKLRQMLAEGHPYDEELYESVMPKPKEQ
ncbi:MAG: enoyl-CoA hydratase-related protein [Chloroflexota bacterium]